MCYDLPSDISGKKADCDPVTLCQRLKVGCSHLQVVKLYSLFCERVGCLTCIIMTSVLLVHLVTHFKNRSIL